MKWGCASGAKYLFGEAKSIRSKISHVTVRHQQDAAGFEALREVGIGVVWRWPRLVLLLRRLCRPRQAHVWPRHRTQARTTDYAGGNGQGLTRCGSQIGGRSQRTSSRVVDETSHGHSGVRKEAMSRPDSELPKRRLLSPLCGCSTRLTGAVPSLHYVLRAYFQRAARVLMYETASSYRRLRSCASQSASRTIRHTTRGRK